MKLRYRTSWTVEYLANADFPEPRVLTQGSSLAHPRRPVK
jgi:hypothetical protein